MFFMGESTELKLTEATEKKPSATMLLKYATFAQRFHVREGF